MNPTDAITVPIAILGTAVLGSITTLIKLWADVQTLKAELGKIEPICKDVANHATDIALLKAAVTRLETIPEKLDRLYDLLRTKA